MEETGRPINFGMLTAGLVYGLGAHRLLVNGSSADQMDESQDGKHEPGAQNLCFVETTPRGKGPESQFELQPDQQQPEMERPEGQNVLDETEKQYWLRLA